MIQRKKRISLLGQRFGKLIVISKTDKRLDGHICWLCKCDCGNEKILNGRNLRNGNTTSCGCYRNSEIKKRFITHGESANGKWSNEYNCWHHIKSRCINVNNKNYKHYGGRGITICDEWINDFSSFLKDMGRKPTLKHSIERIDNNKGYCKENCRWATQREQCNNRRDNKKTVFDNKEYTISQLGEKLGIRSDRLRWQLKMNWTFEQIIENRDNPKFHKKPSISDNTRIKMSIAQKHRYNKSEQLNIKL
jgi:hypothetical protein